ncbi:unnamed protein product [Symbiodinium microadriaticum]|nr:unnamed protein product [Symbiodinium microadriaticum]
MSDQEHHLTDEFREELRATMQETSRYAALKALPASARLRAPKAKAMGKTKMKKTIKKMAKKQHKKQKKKNALAKAAHEAAGVSLFGQQGTIMKSGDERLHMLLEKDHAFPKMGKAWVQIARVERLREGQDKKVWKWAQMTFYRTWKQERLMELERRPGSA